MSGDKDVMIPSRQRQGLTRVSISSGLLSTVSGIPNREKQSDRTVATQYSENVADRPIDSCNDRKVLLTKPAAR